MHLTSYPLCKCFAFELSNGNTPVICMPRISQNTYKTKQKVYQEKNKTNFFLFVYGFTYAKKALPAKRQRRQVHKHHRYFRVKINLE